jgi:hypothetical protein
VVTDRWPTLPLHTVPASYAEQLRATNVLLAGYLRARQTQLSAIPKDAASRGRAFPTPRTWSYAARLTALARAVGAGDDVVRLLVQGTVGASGGHEFLVWAQAQDLPDPEELLRGSVHVRFAGMRPDRLYVVLQSLLSAVVARPTAERWERAVVLCAQAAGEGGLDAAVPVVRALVRPECRPAGVDGAARDQGVRRTARPCGSAARRSMSGAADRLSAAKLWLTAAAGRRGRAVPRQRRLRAAGHPDTRRRGSRGGRAVAPLRQRRLGRAHRRPGDRARAGAPVLAPLLHDHAGRARSLFVGRREAPAWRTAADATVAETLQAAGHGRCGLAAPADLRLPRGGPPRSSTRC